MFASVSFWSAAERGGRREQADGSVTVAVRIDLCAITIGHTLMRRANGRIGGRMGEDNFNLFAGKAVIYVHRISPSSQAGAWPNERKSLSRRSAHWVMIGDSTTLAPKVGNT